MTPEPGYMICDHCPDGFINGDPCPVCRGRSDVEVGQRPVRVQLSRRKGWRMPANTVSVARPGRFGNPHDWRAWRDDWPFASSHPYGCEIDRDRWCRERAVEAFQQDLRDREIVMSIEELRGKNLACWCSLRDWCHADILLELANAPTAEVSK